MAISKDVTITVWHGGTHPPVGKSIQEELCRSKYTHIDFTDSTHGFLREMLKKLVTTTSGLKTGSTVKVTVEIFSRTKNEEFSHIQRNIRVFNRKMRVPSLVHYWSENYEQYKWEGLSLYEHLCREMDLEPIGGYLKS